MGGGGAGVGSMAPLVASLPPRIFNERGSLELQDLGPFFFLESFDLQVCGLGLGHPPPLFFFRLTSNAFLTGSVGRIEKKNHEKSRKRRPGTPASLLWSLETRRHEPKINMAEKLVDVIVKLRQRGKKGSTPETPVR